MVISDDHDEFSLSANFEDVSLDECNSQEVWTLWFGSKIDSTYF